MQYDVLFATAKTDAKFLGAHIAQVSYILSVKTRKKDSLSSSRSEVP
jgi:hypothetical protein